MHGAFLVPAVAAVLGTFFLAHRLSGSPLLAALLALFTPVFLVSATTVMCDVWLLALWVWSVHCWLRGLERHSYWLLLLASLLVAAAALTKYFGVSLVPLLAAYTVARERRLTSRLLFLLIPNAIIGIYEAIAKAKYRVFLPTQWSIPGKDPSKRASNCRGNFLPGFRSPAVACFPLCSMPPSSSSKWIKAFGARYRGFSWQRGYAAFSVSPSTLKLCCNTCRDKKSTIALTLFKTSTESCCADTTLSSTSNMCGIDGD